MIVPLEAPGHRPGLTVGCSTPTSASPTRSPARPRPAPRSSVKSSKDKDEVTASIKLDLVKGQALAEAAGAIITAINLARGGQIDQAKVVLADGEAAARKAAKSLDDPELLAMADRMIELGRNLAQMQVQSQIVGSAIDATGTAPDPMTYVQPRPRPPPSR